MPEVTEVHIALLVAALLAGFVLGWIFRGRRALREKKSISAGWQAQIDSQQSEHDRLAKQNRSLMEQVNQYQASNKDAKLRASELSSSLKEAFERRDDLQRQLKDIRSNLEVAIAQRDKLQTTASNVTDRERDLQQKLAQRDEKIARLRKDLSGWQERVPPLVERYRQRDLEAQQLEVELQKATDRIAALEGVAEVDETRIEAVDPGKLPEGMYASNEPHTETSILSGTAMDDDYEDAANSENAETMERVVAAGEEEAGDGCRADADALVATGNGAADADEAADHEDTAGDGYPDALVAAGNGNADAEEAADHRETADARIEDESEPVEAAQAPSSPRSDMPSLVDDGSDAGLSAQDDLQQIKGIGPAIEKTLNDLDIFRFNQIAELSEYEIDRVAQEIKGFRSRIYREDWIGQARTLQQQKAES